MIQCGFFPARFFSLWRFSRASCASNADFGTVSTFRKAKSRRSAGVPPSGKLIAGGVLIAFNDTSPDLF